MISTAPAALSPRDAREVFEYKSFLNAFFQAASLCLSQYVILPSDRLILFHYDSEEMSLAANFVIFNFRKLVPVNSAVK